MSVCDGCKYRRNIPGDAHSECKHPLGMIEFRHVVFNTGRTNMGLDYDQTAVHNGWFTFPINYDPIWLSKCESREEK